MDKNDAIGAAQVAGGSYLGYKGIEHGLPRALGMRIEYHTTSKENAKLIKQAGNVLDPSFGGKNGWAKKAKRDMYIKNSQNYVHITGVHKDAKQIANIKPFIVDKLGEKYANHLLQLYKTIARRLQCFMYKTVGNIKDIDELNLGIRRNKSESRKFVFDMFKKNLKGNKTTRFCIPGIDSYFNSEFIADTDDIALKSAKKIKAYNNRFSATIAGLKKFGLKGMKENKGRVAFGAGLVATCTYMAAKLIEKGINNMTKQ